VVDSNLRSLGNCDAGGGEGRGEGRGGGAIMLSVTGIPTSVGYRLGGFDDSTRCTPEISKCL
jgi:hypothetical protein